VIRPSHSIGPEDGLVFFACLSVNGMSVEFHVVSRPNVSTICFVR
jgi:hypothetical protein